MECTHIHALPRLQNQPPGAPACALSHPEQVPLKQPLPAQAMPATAVMFPTPVPRVYRSMQCFSSTTLGPRPGALDGRGLETGDPSLKVTQAQGHQAGIHSCSELVPSSCQQTLTQHVHTHRALPGVRTHTHALSTMTAGEHESDGS